MVACCWREGGRRENGEWRRNFEKLGRGRMPCVRLRKEGRMRGKKKEGFGVFLSFSNFFRQYFIKKNYVCVCKEIWVYVFRKKPFLYPTYPLFSSPKNASQKLWTPDHLPPFSSLIDHNLLCVKETNNIRKLNFCKTYLASTKEHGITNIIVITNIVIQKIHQVLLFLTCGYVALNLLALHNLEIAYSMISQSWVSSGTIDRDIIMQKSINIIKYFGRQHIDINLVWKNIHIPLQDDECHCNWMMMSQLQQDGV